MSAARRSAFQLVNRGRAGAPVWLVEENGVCRYSSRRRSLAQSALRLYRRLEREARRKQSEAGK